MTVVVEPLYLIITIVRLCLGSTFLGMAVIESFPEATDPIRNLTHHMHFMNIKLSTTSAQKSGMGVYRVVRVLLLSVPFKFLSNLLVQSLRCSHELSVYDHKFLVNQLPMRI